jgi:hypothetical protein
MVSLILSIYAEVGLELKHELWAVSSKALISLSRGTIETIVLALSSLETEPLLELDVVPDLGIENLTLAISGGMGVIFTEGLPRLYSAASGEPNATVFMARTHYAAGFYQNSKCFLSR